MKIRIQLFAKARELAGADQVALTLPDGGTVSDLRRALGQAVPALLPLLPTLHIAINNDYGRDGDAVPSTAEVAAFPPVSGG